jgi:uncharacterized membrane protein
MRPVFPPRLRSGSSLNQQDQTALPPARAHRNPSLLVRSWISPIVVLLALVGVALALDALLPGLPGTSRGLIGRLMAVMSGICPQRPSHSYTLGGVQLPLEARMMGIFGGFTIGLVELTTHGRRRMHRYPRLAVSLALLLGLGLMAFDGSNAFFFDLHWPHAYAPDLRLRLLTGVLAGLAMAFFLAPGLGQAAPLEAASTGALGWRDVGWAALGSALFALLVASGWGILLVPLSLLGTGGVILAWSTIIRMILWAVTGAHTPEEWQAGRQWLLGALAVILAVGMLALLALLVSLARGSLLPA